MTKKFKLSSLLLHAFFIFLSVCFILPMFSIISISFSSDKMINDFGYTFFPKGIDFSAYKYIFKNPYEILNAYKITIIMSVIGTLIYLIIAGMCAYAISRKTFKYRHLITFFIFFTMLFNGGLVPTYIWVSKYLGLKNSIWALILPGLGNVWYLFLMRTFFSQLPNEIMESATIDGATELTIFSKIVLPLSTPVIATIALFQLLNFWNSWYPALLYIDDQSLYPLQYMLQIMLRNIQEILRAMQEGVSPGTLSVHDLPTDSIRMAMCILAAGPMLFVFPFFQKYFARGITVGSVKG